MTIREGDSPDVRDRKMRFCLAKLELWSRDSVLFINEMGWAPDPKGDFGSATMKQGLAPPRMVPIQLYPAQEALVRDLDRMLDAPGILDINIVKSRQVALTSIAFGWWLLHKWLFRPGFAALLGSFSKEVIDPGGKGHREGDALFPRLRMMLDAMIWAVPGLRFNQHIAKKFSRDAENMTWMTDAEDTSFKLVRPRWMLFGAERYPQARRNTIKGLLPGDAFGKSDIFTVVGMDELGEYSAEIRKGADKDARSAVRSATNHIITTGTLPKGGGAGSELKALCDEGDSNQTLWNRSIHWTDVLPRMMGATWKCMECGTANDWGEPVVPGPGPDGRVRACSACGHKTRVTRVMMDSPWFRMSCAGFRNDPVAIARYLQMDWGASHGDRFFWSFTGRDRLVSPWKHPSAGHLWVPPEQVLFDGFDPGYSSANPASFMVAAYDPKRRVPRVIGYWMEKNTYAAWWVPFFKRWSPRQMQRMTVGYGKNAGKRWLDAFDYGPDALAMLDRISRYPMAVRTGGDIHGDKYGSHQNMGDSPYDVLSEYGVDVLWRYEEREKLMERALDWAGRVELDAGIADVKPCSGTETSYLSLYDVFATAKPRPAAGQSEAKLDVDKQDPPHASHAVDAWAYLCRGFGGEVSARPDSGNEWSVSPEGEAAVEIWGEGAMRPR